MPAATEDFPKNQSGLSSPYTHAAVVSKSDSADLSNVARAIFVGGAGNLNVTTKGGETVVITGLIAGQILPLRVTRVWSTSTTATNILALW